MGANFRNTTYFKVYDRVKKVKKSRKIARNQISQQGISKESARNLIKLQGI